MDSIILQDKFNSVLPINGHKCKDILKQTDSKLKLVTFHQDGWFPDVSSRLYTLFIIRNPNLMSKMLKSYRKTWKYRFQMFILFFRV